MRTYIVVSECAFLVVLIVVCGLNALFAFHDWHRLGECVKGRIFNALVTGLLIGAIVVTIKRLVG